jgi:hypothetical protein
VAICVGRNSSRTSPANSSNFPLGPVGPLFTGAGATRTLVLSAGVGTLGRNTVRTPGEFDLDLAVGRKFPIRERLKLEFRAEAFNPEPYEFPDAGCRAVGNRPLERSSGV